MKKHKCNLISFILALGAGCVLSSSVTVAEPASMNVQGLTQRLEALHLPVYIWSSRRPKAFILALHGGCLHGRSYKTFAKKLVRRNYTVVSMDMRGFGKWYHDGFGGKSDATFDYRQSKEDIVQILGALKRTDPLIPVYIVGESLGANIGISVAAKNPNLVDGIIAVSLTSPKIFFSPRMMLNSAQIVFDPIGKINLRPYLRARLGSNASDVAAQIADPESRDEMSVTEFGKELCANLKGKRDARMLPYDMPVLSIGGGLDALSSSRRSLKFLRKLPLRDKELVLLPDSGHLMVETHSIDPRVMSTITGWLDQHTQSVLATRLQTRPRQNY